MAFCFMFRRKSKQIKTKQIKEGKKQFFKIFVVPFSLDFLNFYFSALNSQIRFFFLFIMSDASDRIYFQNFTYV